MKPIIQIFIAIIILVVCFKLGEIYGKYQILKCPIGVYQKIIHSKQSMEDFKKGGIDELVSDMRDLYNK